MGKKKVLGVEDAIKQFNDVMQRANLSSYYYVNRIILSKNGKGNSILVIPDMNLWLKLIDDENLQLKELCGGEDSKWIKYGEMTEGWIPIDIEEELFKGKIFQIKIKGDEHVVPIDRDLLPLKLKKAEYEGISYRVFLKPPVLAVKKRFEFPMEGYGFSIMRLFQVV